MTRLLLALALVACQSRPVKIRIGNNNNPTAISTAIEASRRINDAVGCVAVKVEAIDHAINTNILVLVQDRDSTLQYIKHGGVHGFFNGLQMVWGNTWYDLNGKTSIEIEDFSDMDKEHIAWMLENTIHEFGHALMLGHTQAEGDIMNPKTMLATETNMKEFADDLRRNGVCR